MRPYLEDVVAYFRRRLKARVCHFLDQRADSPSGSQLCVGIDQYGRRVHVKVWFLSPDSQQVADYVMRHFYIAF